eukprot:scaffold377_cov563-Prasinococcus_capsulatus_cf.AAC.30
MCAPGRVRRACLHRHHDDDDDDDPVEESTGRLAGRPPAAASGRGETPPPLSPLLPRGPGACLEPAITCRLCWPPHPAGSPPRAVAPSPIPQYCLRSPST